MGSMRQRKKGRIMRFFRKYKLIAPVLAAALIFTATGCAEEEKKPTFTGDTTEEPPYQANLNGISPIAYSEVRGLDLEPGTYISIIGKDETSAFWKNVEKGAMQAAADLNKELGYTGSDKIKVVYNAPSKSEDIDEQVNILDEELARYPDVIGIASIDEDACTVQFDLATENGIPVIALDSGNNYPGIQCTVKTDNQDAAKTGAYKLADAIEREGDILLFVHDSKSETAKERTASFQAEIQENYPEVKIAETIYFDKMDDLKKTIAEEKKMELQKETQPEQSEEEQAKQQEETQPEQLEEERVKQQEGTQPEQSEKEQDKQQEGTQMQQSEEELLAAAGEMTDEDVILYYLEKYPEVKGIFGTNDVTTQFAMSVLEEYEGGEAITVMGFDVGAEQIRALEDGKIAGLVVQNPFGIGYASVIAAARTALQAGNEAVVTTGYTWVTKENLESESIQKMLYE